MLDCLCHKLPLGELSLYGMMALTLRWITSYLADRTQHPKISGKVSKAVKIIASVLQGPFLGPTVSCLSVSDILKLVSSLQIHLISCHDTTCSISSTVMFKALNTTIRALAELSNYYKANRFQLIIETKTESVVLKTNIKRLANISDHFSSQDHQISSVSSSKFWGVYIPWRKSELQTSY